MPEAHFPARGAQQGVSVWSQVACSGANSTCRILPATAPINRNVPSGLIESAPVWNSKDAVLSRTGCPQPGQILRCERQESFRRAYSASLWSLNYEKPFTLDPRSSGLPVA